MSTSNPDERPSKSALKREALALQELGESLTALPAQRLRSLGLDPDILEVVERCRRMARDGARQRELRYLGKLLRRVDTAPLHAALDADGQQARREAHRLHQVEALREALLSDPEPTLAQLASEHGEDSLAEIRALLDQIARLPEGGERKKRTRSLFRVLRALPEARG